MRRRAEGASVRCPYVVRTRRGQNGHGRQVTGSCCSTHNRGSNGLRGAVTRPARMRVWTAEPRRRVPPLPAAAACMSAAATATPAGGSTPAWGVRSAACSTPAVVGVRWSGRLVATVGVAGAAPPVRTGAGAPVRVYTGR